MVKHKRRGRDASTYHGAPKEVREMLDAAVAAGAVVTQTGSGHYQVRHADGVATVSGSPRDAGLEAKRSRSRLRNQGLDV